MSPRRSRHCPFSFSIRFRAYTFWYGAVGLGNSSSIPRITILPLSIPCPAITAIITITRNNSFRDGTHRTDRIFTMKTSSDAPFNSVRM
jgi:hypothetical protein